MKPHISTLTYLSLAIIICICSSARSTSILPKDPFLGISPQDEAYYKSSGDVIKCKDGSKKFTKAQLNDDFCDCPDGSDEPGTSACPTGKFYCRNAGHSPFLLFSSRVNDGICDCCDGSDEYDGKVKCQNTCWEAGKVARDKLKKKIATYQEGVTIRNQEIEKAKLAIAKDETELSKLKNEVKTLKSLVQELKERKEQIEKAEEEERLQKEKAEKAAKEAEEKKNGEMKSEDEKQAVIEEDKVTETKNDDVVGLIDEDVEEYNEPIAEATNDGGKEDYNVDEDGKNVGDDKEASELEHEINRNEGSSNQAVEPEKVSDTDELSREELGRLVASRWTGENSDSNTDEAHGVKSEDHESHDDPSKNVHDEQYDEYASDSDNDNQTYDDHEEETEEPIDDFDEEDRHYKDDSHDDSYTPDVATTRSPSWSEKIQQTVWNIIQSVNLFKTPVNISEAAQVRKEYDESSDKLSKIESRISSLTQKLKQDFGPQKEFYSFYDHCFESKQNKYVYKVCPFKQASQVEGHSKTTLGSWDKFDDSYKSMVFSNGDKCWNGPDRSLKVKLRCGLTNEVTDVDEPSRCEYVALLATPALCQEDKLKELKQKLELMSKDQPSGHDEL